MTTTWQELSTASQRDQLAQLARRQNWGLALVLAGWLHLAAFLVCYWMTVGLDYHGAPGYLAVWASEFAGVVAIGWLCGVWARTRAAPLATFIMRVWIAYFV